MICLALCKLNEYIRQRCSRNEKPTCNESTNIFPVGGGSLDGNVWIFGEESGLSDMLVAEDRLDALVTSPGIFVLGGTCYISP